MANTGEIISLTVACLWTINALLGDAASHRIGAMPLNIIRMVLSIALLAILLWIMTGAPYPQFADGKVWLWMTLSGVVGYVFGDYCLFNSYVIFGSKYGQLFMTLAPPFAGITSWLMLGETMTGRSWLAMAVTLAGIAICVLAKGSGTAVVKLKLPLKGVLLGIGAGLGQGVGLVLSKVGLNHYSEILPSEAPQAVATMMPFAGTFIRAIAGAVGFGLIIILGRSCGKVSEALHNRTGMILAFAATIFGPFVGVSLSLMAVQYAKAGIASTLMALVPVLIIVPYAIIHHQRISIKEVFGTIVTMVGVALFFL